MINNIKTLAGDITPETSPDEKELVFGEIQRSEEVRFVEAQRSLLSRLSEDKKMEAWRWVQFYKGVTGYFT